MVLVTTSGVVKRISPEELSGTSSGKTVIKLKPNDKVAAAFTCPDGVDTIIVASDAQTLRTPVDNISVQGRNASGVIGMKLRDGVKVVGAGAALGDGAVITITDTGSAKATPFEELTTKGRGAPEYVLRNSRKRNRFHLQKS